MNYKNPVNCSPPLTSLDAFRKLNRITKNGKANIAGSINLELSSLNQTTLAGDSGVTDHYEEVGGAAVHHGMLLADESLCKFVSAQLY